MTGEHAHLGGRRSLLRRLGALGTLPMPTTLALSPRAAHAARPSRSTDATPFRFALLGDVPYNALEESGLRQVLDAIESDCEFVIHVGDIKSSGERCDDSLLTARHRLLTRHPTRPLLLVPGDNEWVDCQRAIAGGFDRWERLRKLRALFFPVRTTGRANPIKIMSQRELAVSAGASAAGEAPVENLVWMHGGAMFVTLNRPGGVDVDRLGAQEAAGFIELAAHNERWLRAAFGRARQTGARALLIAAHANPGFGRDDPTSIHLRRADPHRPFRRLLAELSLSFDGQVLFAHGDTHRHQVNRPLRDAEGRPISNLLRVETFGSPFSASWLQISVDAASADPGQVFQIQARHLEIARSP